MINKTTQPSRSWFLFAAVVASFVAGCADPPATGAPNLLIVSLDTTRADHTSVHGYERETTPCLRRFAEEGARFTQAYSASATTGPSHATLFTSLHPPSHGLLKNGALLDDELTTLAEILRDDGYRTGGVAGSYVLSHRFGYDQGFEEWDDRFDPATASKRHRKRWLGHDVAGGFDRRADDTTRRAIRWLEQRDGREPFFLFVHYFDPHHPYEPPEPFRSRFDPASGDELEEQVSRYDGEIAFTDEQVGKLLESLDRAGLRDETLVVVTGDHGEGLMQRGYWRHSLHLYEEGVRVPLLIRFPARIAAGTVIETPVAGVDLLPTILDLLAREAPAAHGFQGKSLADALRGAAEPDEDRPIFLTRRHYDEGEVDSFHVKGIRYAVRSGRFKYFGASEDGPAELYDLVDDPLEQDDLVVREVEQAAAMKGRLEQWLASQTVRKTKPLEISEEERKKLEALGYVE